MNDKLPIIEQLHNADGDRARAAILLRCPDSVLLKYDSVFLDACRHFKAGALFVLKRTVAMRAVRSEAGALPGGMQMEIEMLRAGLAAFAAGADWSPGQAQGPPSIDI